MELLIWQWIQGVLEVNTIFRNPLNKDRKRFGTKLLHKNMHVVNLYIFQEKVHFEKYGFKGLSETNSSNTLFLTKQTRSSDPRIAIRPTTQT